MKTITLITQDDIDRWVGYQLSDCLAEISNTFDGVATYSESLFETGVLIPETEQEVCFSCQKTTGEMTVNGCVLATLSADTFKRLYKKANDHD